MELIVVTAMSLSGWEESQLQHLYPQQPYLCQFSSALFEGVLGDASFQHTCFSRPRELPGGIVCPMASWCMVTAPVVLLTPSKPHSLLTGTSGLLLFTGWTL